MFYEHFIATNPHEHRSVLTRLWNNSMVRILCCSCIDKGLSEFTPAQIELKCFIESQIGIFKFKLYFGALNNRYREEEYHETIPGRNLNLSIAKKNCEMEQIFRTKFEYKTIKLNHFQKALNRFYHKQSFSIIYEIIGADDGLIIEIPKTLAPCIISNQNLEYIGLLAPILVQNPSVHQKNWTKFKDPL
jgi:hypothetical protein